MSKQTKTSKTAAPVRVEPVVVAAPVVAAPVVVEKKAAKKAAKKVEEPTTIVAASVEVKEEVVAAQVVETVVETPLLEQSTNFFAKLQQLGSVISSLKAEYRSLEKKWTKELMTSAKNGNK